MNIYEKAQENIENMNPKSTENFWKNYFVKEEDVYQKILSNKDSNITGKFLDLSKEYNLTEDEFVFFLDGINSSLEKEIDFDNLSTESDIEISINFSTLYLNMLRNKANWLYELEEWDGILSKDDRNEIFLNYHQENIQKKSVKIGRNDPCPCGSGKKYKKCCLNKN